jgi:NAD(P)H-dependent FMN reductase
MAATKVLVMAGSSRSGTLSGKLATAAEAAVRAAGAEVTRVDLRALAMPLYDGDIEAARGVPQGAKDLRALFAGHHALLLATPEYNGFPTPLVINAFDWLSRVPAEADLPQGLLATAGKVAGLVSSSPGALGGLRSMNYLRQYLQMAFGMHVVPQQFALGQAHAAFDEAGQLKDAKHLHALEGVVGAAVKLASLLKVG